MQAMSWQWRLARQMYIKANFNLQEGIDHKSYESTTSKAKEQAV